MHDVVPMAVNAAVAAAMTIRSNTSQTEFFFIRLFIFHFLYFGTDYTDFAALNYLFTEWPYRYKPCNP